MTSTSELISRLKEVRQAKNLSYQDIVDMTKGAVSKTTVSRVFADGSEEVSFRFEETLKPISSALLNIDTIEETDNTEIQAMKSLLHYKSDRIVELEKQIADLNAALNKEKVKYHEKLDAEREQYFRRIDFLKDQVSLKDKRMDMLLEAVFQKDMQHKELLELILSCPARKGQECK